MRRTTRAAAAAAAGTGAGGAGTTAHAGTSSTAAVPSGATGAAAGTDTTAVAAAPKARGGRGSVVTAAHPVGAKPPMPPTAAAVTAGAAAAAPAIIAPPPLPAAAPSATPSVEDVSRRLSFSAALEESVSTTEPLQVYLRIKPVNDGQTTQPIEIVDTKTVCLVAPAGSQASKTGDASAKYEFNAVFPESTTQEQLFESTLRPIVDKCIQYGQHALVFAYGMTNAGKTHTVLGHPGTAEGGLLPRALERVFYSIKPGIENVSVSYCEVYNEKVFDLLQPASKIKERTALELKDDKDGQVQVHGLKEVPVTSVASSFEVVRQGTVAKQAAATKLNEDSSRSHCVFTITITRPNAKGDIQLWSRISIVDLAGAERSLRTGNLGDRMREATKINSSLMTLKRCLDVMRQNQQNPSGPQRPVPFRDSKLTRLFQNMLVGRVVGSTIMVLCAGQLAEDFDETLHTVKWAAVAREVTVSKSKVDSRWTTRASVEVPSAAAAAAAATAAPAPAGRPAKRKSGEMDAPRASASTADLLATIAGLQEQVSNWEYKCAVVEEQVRDEVAQSMAQRLEEMEKFYQSRHAQAVASQQATVSTMIRLHDRRTATAKKRRSTKARRPRLSTSSDDASPAQEDEDEPMQAVQQQHASPDPIDAITDDLQAQVGTCNQDKHLGSRCETQIVECEREINRLRCRHAEDVADLMQKLREAQAVAAAAATASAPSALNADHDMSLETKRLIAENTLLRSQLQTASTKVEALEKHIAQMKADHQLVLETIKKELGQKVSAELAAAESRAEAKFQPQIGMLEKARDAAEARVQDLEAALVIAEEKLSKTRRRLTQMGAGDMLTPDDSSKALRRSSRGNMMPDAMAAPAAPVAATCPTAGDPTQAMSPSALKSLRTMVRAAKANASPAAAAPAAAASNENDAVPAAVSSRSFQIASQLLGATPVAHRLRSRPGRP